MSKKEKESNGATARVEYLPPSALTANPTNPRTISKDKFAKLCQSLKDFPQMLEIRPIVIDEDSVVLGGNMRLEAAKAIGLPLICCQRVVGLTPEQKKEFVIKDNSSFGDWDWSALANQFDASALLAWGLDLPEEWADPEGDAGVKQEVTKCPSCGQKIKANG